MTQRDYYEILGVARGATDADIKGAYRKLAMLYHPDRNPDDPAAEEKFKEAAEAYDVLSDSNKRSRYDRFGHSGVQGSADFHTYSNINDVFSAFSDIFGSSVFGDFFGQQQSRSRKQRGDQGSDLRLNLQVTLEEIATGVEKTVRIKHYKTCQTCSGSGAEGESAYDTCSECNGTGERRHVTRSVFGQFINVSPCSTCDGTGEILRHRCSACGGEGRTEGESTVKVTIPAGVRTGNYLTVTGKGHAGRRGGPSGDAIVVLEEIEHEFFHRVDDDIFYDLIVDFPTASLGGEVEVPTLQGVSVVKIEPGTQPMTLLSLKGKGIPHLQSRGRGDQVLRFNIYVPKSLSSKEKSILKDLAGNEHFKPPTDNRSKHFFEKLKEVFT